MSQGGSEGTAWGFGAFSCSSGLLFLLCWVLVAPQAFLQLRRAGLLSSRGA